MPRFLNRWAILPLLLVPNSTDLMPDKDFKLSTHYVPCRDRRLFSLLFESSQINVRGSVLFLHSFAEELQKSRRPVAVQARALARSGYNVLLLDLSGCGDSSGVLRDARWAVWQEDAVAGVEFLRQRSSAPLSLWGLRFGALLACQLAQDLADVERLLMWQPALNGEQYLDQFLRLELAGQTLKGEAGFDRAGLWNELRSGNTLDVAGYQVSSNLAMDFAQVRLGDLSPNCAVNWMDMAVTPTIEPKRAIKMVMDRWREKSLRVDWQCAQALPFYRNLDVDSCPQLTIATMGVFA
jgi:exosortase A-associated hydrolase 2